MYKLVTANQAPSSQDPELSFDFPIYRKRENVPRSSSGGRRIRAPTARGRRGCGGNGHAWEERTATESRLLRCEPGDLVGGAGFDAGY